MLKALHELTSNETLSFEDKVTALLRLGLSYYDLEHAIVSQIQDDVYTVRFAVSENPELGPGLTFNLGDTYCVHTLKTGAAMALSCVADCEIAAHPCYELFQLESYIGMQVVVNGQPYGTLNFTSSSPRKTPFTPEDIDFIHLFAQWVGVEISRKLEHEQLDQRLALQLEMEELANIGAWEVNLETGVLYWSAQTKKIHEVPADYEPKLETAINFYHEGADRDEIVEVVERAIQFGEPWSREVRLKTYNGNIKWVATRGKAEFKEGKCVRIFGAFQDINDQLKTRQALIDKKDEAQRLLKARSTMIGKISHELRTPINGITGMLQTLVGETNPDIVESRVAIALRSADLLVRLINDVLDYSKVQHGELELKNVRFAPRHIFDDLYALYQPQCQAKNIELDFRLDVTASQYTKGDPGRLTQIFSNLINNALKFTEAGGIKLTAKLKPNDNNSVLVVNIIDSGIGMDRAAMKDLFTPFKQGSAEITAKYGGSGLGVAIVKELCDKLGGSLTYKSSKGVGTQACVKIPLTVSEDTRTSVAVSYAEPQNINYEQLKILVVDDNEINRLVMESLLSQVNASADYVVDGKKALEAVQQARNKPYSLIFMDCEMPVMGGIDATLAIREKFKQAGKIFIVAMTADTSDDNRAACLKAGMDTFLTKPVKLEEITAVLNRAAVYELGSF